MDCPIYDRHLYFCKQSEIVDFTITKTGDGKQTRNYFVTLD